MANLSRGKSRVTSDSRLDFQNLHYGTKTANLLKVSHLREMNSIDRMVRSPLVEQMNRINRMMSPLVEQMNRINRMMSPLVEQMNRINRMMSPLVEQMNRIDRMMQSPLVEQMNRINRISSMSVNSFLSDLQHNSEVDPFPIYIPSKHLGSGPFREDTEQDDTDSLMVIRKSDLHPYVLKSCEMELSSGDYFHAIEEAIKGLFQRMRDLTGLRTDGFNLVEQAFEKSPPPIALNSLRTSSQRNVQGGFIYSLKGLIFMYRHPLAHEPKVTWLIGETEALIPIQLDEAA